jgi:hypothetical protein
MFVDSASQEYCSELRSDANRFQEPTSIHIVKDNVHILVKTRTSGIVGPLRCMHGMYELGPYTTVALLDMMWRWQVVVTGSVLQLRATIHLKAST